MPKYPSGSTAKAYYEKKTRIIGPQYGKDIWGSIGDVIDELKADPFDYIEAQFAIPASPRHLDRYGFVRPIHLYRQDAISRYLKYMSQGGLGFSQQVSAQVIYLKGLIEAKMDKGGDDTELILSDILMDPSSPIRPFARILLCPWHLTNKILARFRDRIEIELGSDPGLKNYIKRKYGSRYTIVYPERIPESDGSECSEEPRSPEEPGQRRIVARKLRKTDA